MCFLVIARSEATKQSSRAPQGAPKKCTLSSLRAAGFICAPTGAQLDCFASLAMTALRPSLRRHASPHRGRMRRALQPEVVTERLARILGLEQAAALQLGDQQGHRVLDAFRVDRRAQQEAVGDLA